MQDPSVWNQYYNQQPAGCAAAAAAPQPTFGAVASQHYQTVPGAMTTAVSQAPQQIHQQMQQPMQANLGQPAMSMANAVNAGGMGTSM